MGEEWYTCTGGEEERKSVCVLLMRHSVCERHRSHMRVSVFKLIIRVPRALAGRVLGTRRGEEKLTLGYRGDRVQWGRSTRRRRVDGSGALKQQQWREQKTVGKTTTRQI